jgi:hypothetical protein
MLRKADIAARMPDRRWLREDEAAVHCSLSPSFFRQLWQNGEMPSPRELHNCLIWDRLELDATLEALPRRGEDVIGSVDTWADFGNGAVQAPVR